MNIIDTNLSFRNALSHNNNPKELILHHIEGNGWTVERLHSLHKDSFGWSGIGYHFYIRKDGTIYRGRPEWAIGAHCKGANTNTIGIAFEGRYQIETSMPKEQFNAGMELIQYLKNKYGNLPIYGHRERGDSDCPGKYFPLSDFKNGVASNTVKESITSNVANDNSVKDKKARIINIDSYLNVRETPNGKVIGTLKNGDIVTLWRLEGDWYHIYSPVKGYNQAYVHKNYVQILQTSDNSSSSKTALIKRLQEEIVKQGFGSCQTTGVIDSKTIDSAPICKKGAKGNITRIIQDMLLNMGYKNFLDPYGADGSFGSGTEDAIKHFQTTYGLSSDGIVGRNTWKKFFEKLN